MDEKRELKNLTYGIVGLGIMGGSFAKSIRSNILDAADASGKIFACGRRVEPLVMAQKEGVVDSFFLSPDVDQMLSQCDVLFVCLYPHATLEFIKTHAGAFKRNSIVTDISGVKTFLLDGINDIKNTNNVLANDVDVILGHPMAGGEKEGYVNSNAAFFKGRNYILLPQIWNKRENIDLLKRLIAAMGFSRIVETDCKNHDRKIAFTSQLCHVIAAALIESAEDEKITEFGGGSFEDLTRIAMINAPLWTELFLSNKDALLAQIINFEKQLEIIKTYLTHGDAESLERYLANVREKRMDMAVSHVDAHTHLR